MMLVHIFSAILGGIAGAMSVRYLRERARCLSLETQLADARDENRKLNDTLVMMSRQATIQNGIVAALRGAAGYPSPRRTLIHRGSS